MAATEMVAIILSSSVREMISRAMYMARLSSSSSIKILDYTSTQMRTLNTLTKTAGIALQLAMERSVALGIGPSTVVFGRCIQASFSLMSRQMRPHSEMKKKRTIERTRVVIITTNNYFKMFKKAYSKSALRSARSYNTLIERQTNYMPVNMDTTMLINMFEGLSLTYGLSLPQFLLATQVSLRLLHLPIQYFIKRIIPDSELMKKHDLAYRRYILNDLERDCTRYDIGNAERDKMIKTYEPSRIAAWAFTGYWQYILYKSLSIVSNYPQYYPQWDSAVGGVFGKLSGTILAHDQTFILPLAVMMLNYKLLSNSKQEHPWDRTIWSGVRSRQVSLNFYTICIIQIPQQRREARSSLRGATQRISLDRSPGFQHFAKDPSMLRVELSLASQLRLDSGTSQPMIIHRLQTPFLDKYHKTVVYVGKGPTSHVWIMLGNLSQKKITIINQVKIILVYLAFGLTHLCLRGLSGYLSNRREKQRLGNIFNH